MDNNIILADGTVIENSHVLNMDNRLFVYIESGMSLLDAVVKFSDPTVTNTIKEYRYGEESTYTGYTDLYSASREYGNTNLVLKKAE